MLRTAVMHWYRQKYLRYNVASVEHSCLGPVISADIGFHLRYKVILICFPVEWSLNPVRKCLVSQVAVIPLLHQWTHLCRHIRIVAFSVHRLEALLTAPAPPSRLHSSYEL